MRNQVEYKKVDYMVPLFQIGGAALTNMPAGDAVEVLSDSASDTNKLTLVGTNNTTGALKYETIDMNGTNVVTTDEDDWGNIYGYFLGDVFGKNSSVAVGTITVREASGDAQIGTLTAGNRSHGNLLFDLRGKNIVFHNISGNTWVTLDDQLTYPTTNDTFKLTAGMGDEYKTEKYIFFLGDTSGSTAQIKVNKD